jgi:hypothetical protein
MAAKPIINARTGKPVTRAEVSGETPDILALTCFVGGAGSWFRASTEAEAVAGLKRVLKSDWGKMLKKGAELEVGLYDVRGHDRVVMGANGVFGDGREAKCDIAVPMLRIEKVTV